jgi:small-conductance mechanosensitive channel
MKLHNWHEPLTNKHNGKLTNDWENVAIGALLVGMLAIAAPILWGLFLVGKWMFLTLGWWAPCLAVFSLALLVLVILFAAEARAKRLIAVKNEIERAGRGTF